MDRPVLPRSISSANLQCTKDCVSHLEADLSREGSVNHVKSLPHLTLTLPSLNDYPKPFTDYVYRRLVDHRVKEELETARVINWCKNASSLIPLSTTGDGNCLLHASSLAMWGFQDRKFILRQAVYSALLHDNSRALLYPRWKLWRGKEMASMGVELEESQWRQEWGLMIDTASLVSNGGSLQGLEQFHIFILANVLRRPIIVYSLGKIHSAVEGATLQRINFQGLYLPLLWDPKDCIRSPLPIAFSNGHYVGLVVKNAPEEYKNGRIIIPIVQNSHEFPVMFMTNKENEWDLRQAYLNITYIPNLQSSGGVVCAEIQINEQPAYMRPLVTSFIDKCLDAYQFEQSQARVNNNQVGVQRGGRSGTNMVQDGRVLCKNGCGFYGDPKLNGYCSQCSKKLQQAAPPVTSNSLRCCNCQLKQGLPSLAGMCEQCYHSKKTGSGRDREERKLSGGPPNTAPVTDYVPRPCRNSGCEYTGTKDRLYYCSTCYKEKYPNGHHDTTGRDRSGSGGGGMSRPVSDIKDELVLNGGGRRVSSTGPRPGSGDIPRPGPGDIPRPGPGDIPRSSAQPTKCSSCKEFYGTKEYGGLCHKCFLERTKKLESSKDPPSTSRASKPLSESYCTRCGRLPGCESFKGMCNECYFNSEDYKSRLYSQRQGWNESTESTDSPILQRAHSREPLPPSPVVPSVSGLQRATSQPIDQYGSSHRVDSPLCPRPDLNPSTTQSTARPQSLYRTTRNSTAVTQSCFLCDPDQLITISNVVCQQHALKMKEIWYRMTSPPVYSDDKALPTTNGTLMGEGATPSVDQRQYEEPLKPVKVLCRTVGCSYEQIPQYHGYCEDCFKSKK